MERETFGSRLGFILISAGCAIGLGNVWRFPYVVGKYGGAAFLLIYLFFLLTFGIPIMAMEFSVGRASRKSVADSFRTLEPRGTKWHLFGGVGVVGNYLLMMFYTSITGFMFVYFLKMLRGDFISLPADYAGTVAQFSEETFLSVTGNPWLVAGFMILSVALGFVICSFGVQKGVEKITKVMMLALLVLISILAVRSLTLPGAGAGIRYYLVPDFSVFTRYPPIEIIFAAMGQAFFTLSIGMGSMAIFGSYIGREKRLLGEATSVAVLDTFVAFVAGLIVIPACTAYNVNMEAGPSLLFEALPCVFNGMPGGRVWGSLFFLFMIFAAMSTVIAVFENIVNFGVELWGWSRRKSSVINIGLVIVLSMPCVLGFNLWSEVRILGFGISDFEDFIISQNILPLGSLVYVLFCTSKKRGWGWDNFMEEVNAGSGMRFPKALYGYAKYVLPVILIGVWVLGYINIFWPQLLSK